MKPSLTFGARAGVGGLAALCLLLGYAVGRAGGGPDPTSASYLSQLSHMLQLRPDQVAAIDAVLADEDRDLEELVMEHRGAMQGPVASRRQATEQAVLALLDAEQRKRYDELSQPGPEAERAR